MGSRRIGIGHYNALRMYLCCKNTVFFNISKYQEVENRLILQYYSTGFENEYGTLSCPVPRSKFAVADISNWITAPFSKSK